MTDGGQGKSQGALARLRAWAAVNDDNQGDWRTPIPPIRWDGMDLGPAELDRWTPEQIVEWEAHGQRWVVENDVLPRTCEAHPRRPSAWPLHRSWRERRSGPPSWTGHSASSSGLSFEDEELLTMLGFRLSQIRDEIGDVLTNLFMRATLPAGWHKVPTDHNQWVYVIDDRGLRRVEIFFKNSPNERRAFMRLVDVGAYFAADLLSGREETPGPWHRLTEAERADVVTSLESKIRPADEADTTREDDDTTAKARELLASLESLVTPTDPQR